MASHHQEVAQQIDKIVAEMKRLGLWEQEPKPDDSYEFEHPHDIEKPFAHWLQHKLVPRVLRTIQTQGDFPAKSRVATQASVEFLRYDEDTSTLLALLREFDALFE
ncbi:MAG: YqcC family protein [Anaerolineae bacterium]|nr:YqcC family protein [Anaerolineae bacterium]